MSTIPWQFHAGATVSTNGGPADDGAEPDWARLGAQVYGNTCASCHQVTGGGLPGVFPALRNNPAVVDSDPTNHISAILNGLSGKEIDGVLYLGLMPPFGATLSDEDIAAVTNHERTQWGNDAPLVTVTDVRALRN